MVTLDPGYQDDSVMETMEYNRDNFTVFDKLLASLVPLFVV